MNDEIKIIQMESAEISSYQEKASLDVQIATAKHYPRDVIQCKNDAVALATMDLETAESCGYSLPRGNKPIQGPSVHAARILVQNWGNIRVESRITEITSTQIVSQAVCFDLQKNYANKVEVRRSIINRFGKRFNDDMITVTGNAANAISFRNAVFSVIPKNVINAVYKETRNMISGDLSDQIKLVAKREKVLKGFKDSYGVSEEEILKLLGCGLEGIKQEKIVYLISIAQSIKDGDTTADLIFDRNSDKKKTGTDKKNNLKKKTETPKNNMP